eukprot:scaffold3079_cov119-Cylindrotheca_fusiformis.AAC.15
MVYFASTLSVARVKTTHGGNGTQSTHTALIACSRANRRSASAGAAASGSGAAGLFFLLCFLG